MTKKLTDKAPSNGFARGAGSQMGTKSRAILELLRKGKPTNRLDIEMMLGYPVAETISRLIQLTFIRKSTWGSGNGCYEITNIGRQALGESLALPDPTAMRICAATSTGHYIPGLHNISQSMRSL